MAVIALFVFDLLATAITGIAFSEWASGLYHEWLPDVVVAACTCYIACRMILAVIYPHLFAHHAITVARRLDPEEDIDGEAHGATVVGGP